MSGPRFMPGLKSLSRRAAGCETASAGARLVALAVACFLSLAAVDALTPMHALLRTAIAVAAVVAAAGALVRAAQTVRRAWPGPPAAARVVEERLGLANNPIINAMQLSRAATTGDSFSEALIGRAVERGEAAWQAADKACVLRPELSRARTDALMMLLIAAAAAGTWLAAPQVFRAVTPRLVQPWADHPPYSPTDFTLTIDPAAPVVGDDVIVRVEVSRRLPEWMRLIVESGDASRPITMAPDDDGRDPARRAFTATLRRVREPIRVHAEADTGRSRSLRIVPDAEPRIIESSLRVVPPAYTRRLPLVRAGAAGSLGLFDVIEGSDAAFSVTATLPLTRGGVEVRPSDGVLISTSERTLSVSWRATTTRHVSIRPVGESGAASRDEASAVVQARPDQPPTLSLKLPAWEGADLLAPANATLVFEAGASDDLGLSVLGLAWSRLDRGGAWVGQGLRMRVRGDDPPLISDERSPVRFVHRLPLHDAGIQPGDTLIISLLARDTRPAPLGGGQEATVGPIVVRIADTTAGGCSGRREGWIEVFSSDQSSGEAPADDSTWTADQQEPSGEPPTSKPGAGGIAARPLAGMDPLEAGDDASRDASAMSGEGESDAASERRAASAIPVDPGDVPADSPPFAAVVPGSTMERPADAGDPSPLATKDDWSRLPPAYRDLAARYFSLLARMDRDAGRE